MKILLNDRVYLQKADVAFLLHRLPSCPVSILNECFGGEKSIFFMNDPDADGLVFDQVFAEPENVKWLREQGWIVDYASLHDMTIVELEANLKRFRSDISDYAKAFNEQTEAYRREHFDEVIEYQTMHIHCADDYENMLRYLRGEIYFNLPEGAPAAPHLSFKAKLRAVFHR